MDKPLKVAPGGIVYKAALLPIEDRSVWFAQSAGQTLAYTIGGKLEGSETPRDAVIRETKEEADVDLIVSSIKFYNLFKGPCHGYVEGTKLYMYSFFGSYNGTLRPRNEIKRLVLLNSSDIGKSKTTVMGDDMLRRLAADNFID